MLLTGNASKLVALRTPYVCVKSLGCVAARNRISSRPLLAAPGSGRHVHRVFGGGSSSRPLSVPASATTRGVTGVEQGTSSDSSSSRLPQQQQQQQQQQTAAWAQAQQWRQQAGMTGQAVPAAAAAAAAPGSGVAAVPTLDHSSTIPLHLDGDAVKDASGNVLLQQLSSLASLNVRESQHGALVFGAASQHGPACCWDLTVGKLKFSRYLACARNKLWWMTPEWGSSLHTLPPETQFLLLQLDESSSSSGEQRYALLLPLIDGDFRGTLRPNR
ncbi:hypothetical protein OEZ85_006014 [Tetradesmus obliquus]|uniref:Uncharacterized protein n=1 Tax=Tetradesmus obliquus TaxID=3088 RepID=A0ABY8UIF5_TETOB|nr:hypothetical protein OEZ85_006014 [Tetradesmus obliquus]